jgi:hypothetical protein
MKTYFQSTERCAESSGYGTCKSCFNCYISAAAFSLCGYVNDTLQSTQQLGFAVKSNEVNTAHSVCKLYSASNKHNQCRKGSFNPLNQTSNRKYIAGNVFILTLYIPVGFW